jgi:hypothetical protein
MFFSVGIFSFSFHALQSNERWEAGSKEGVGKGMRSLKRRRKKRIQQNNEISPPPPPYSVSGIFLYLFPVLLCVGFKMSDVHLFVS